MLFCKHETNTSTSEGGEGSLARVCFRLFNNLLIVCYQSNANKQAQYRRVKLADGSSWQTMSRRPHGVCVMRKSKSLISGQRTGLLSCSGGTTLRLLSSKFDLYAWVCLRLCHAHKHSRWWHKAPLSRPAGRPDRTTQERREQGRTVQDRTGQEARLHDCTIAVCRLTADCAPAAVLWASVSY